MPNSPAYYTLAWHRLRLLIGQGKADEARAELDRQLAAPALPEGVGNLMRYQRLKLARDIGEFAKFALRRGEFLMYLYDPRTKLDAWPLPLPPTKWDSYIATVVGWRTEIVPEGPALFRRRRRLRHVVLHAAADDGAGRARARAAGPYQARHRAGGVDARRAARRRRDRAVRWRMPSRRSFRNTPTAGRAIAAPPPATRPKRSRPRCCCSSCPPPVPIRDSGLGYMYKRDVIGRFGPRWWATDDTAFANGTTRASPCSARRLRPAAAADRAAVRHGAGQGPRQGGQRSPGQAAGRAGLARGRRHSVGEGASERSPGSGGAAQRGAGDPIRRHGLRHLQGRLRFAAQPLPAEAPGPPRHRSGSEEARAGEPPRLAFCCFDQAAAISNSVSSSGLSTMMSCPLSTPCVRQVGSALHCASHLSNAGCG